ncbi:MAG TPA: metallophosphoesterase [Acidobacteriota bacterium]|nr:metallophosphoesterase [Acidobacteriota bacterium]
MKLRNWLHAVCLILAAASLLTSRPVALLVQAGEPPPRVVAIGDIHGAFDSFTGLLKRLELIDERQRWIGGNSILVQTGDFLDRGPGERPLMDLLRDLPKQAEKAGGRVIVLLGNHEVMNLIGDFRYVPAEGFESFSNSGSARKRERALQQYLRHLNRQASSRNDPILDSQDGVRQAWLEEHPEGFIERMEAFSSGEYGKWLRRLPAVARVEDSLFLHGGVHPDLSSYSPEEINRRIAQELRLFDRYRRYLERHQVVLPFFTLSEMELAVHRELELARSRSQQALSGLMPENSDENQHIQILEAFLSSVNWWIRHPDGPLWFRGYATWPEEGEEVDSRIDRLLDAFSVRRLVVGHTPMLEDGVQGRFGGRIFLTDTGMLSSYYPGGRASALVIEKGSVQTVSLDP